MLQKWSHTFEKYENTNHSSCCPSLPFWKNKLYFISICELFVESVMINRFLSNVIIQKLWCLANIARAIKLEFYHETSFFLGPISKIWPKIFTPKNGQPFSKTDEPILFVCFHFLIRQIVTHVHVHIPIIIMPVSFINCERIWVYFKLQHHKIWSRP